MTKDLRRFPKVKIIGNNKSYYIYKDYIDIWRYEDDFEIEINDIPWIETAIKELKKLNKRRKF